MVKTSSLSFLLSKSFHVFHFSSRAHNIPFLSKVRECRCCFSLATLGGAVPLCRWLTDGCCGCVYCYKVCAPPPMKDTKGSKFPSERWSEVSVGVIWVCVLFLGSFKARPALEGNFSRRSWLRWRRSWGEAGRGAERRGWGSDGRLRTCRHLSASAETAGDPEPPGSYKQRSTGLRVSQLQLL